MQHSNTAGCILLKFYIKPQHTANVYNLLYVVSYRNSTSNHNMSHWRATSQGVVSYRNSTSNHNFAVYSVTLLWVVSYRNSTSNHNRIRLRFSERIVVSYRNSTSNHNKNNGATAIKMLYLIEILHQTTTDSESDTYAGRLYLIEILHQTTTLISVSSFSTSCILSKFYIKPQLPVALLRYVVVVSYRNSTSNHNQNTRSIGRSIVVSYRNSTSNHNRGRTLCGICELYLIEILHQTTTTVAFSVATACCILSKFYIKPQPSRRRLPTCGVVSYRNSTSNHNPVQIRNDKGELYLIEILHQTTTFRIALFASMGCILSKFYIKPQLACGWYDLRRVVSYRNSTSNHNKVE